MLRKVIFLAMLLQVFGQPAGKLCGTIAGFPCDEGLTCDYEPGMCGATDLAGTCEPAPEACAEIYAPVCGCDGTTYGNDCERLTAGAQKDHDGECQPSPVPPVPPSPGTDGERQLCGTIAGLSCPSGFTCELPEGQCGANDAAGFCTLRPEVCALIYAPVCGCDGRTYGNDCERLGAGVQKDRDGEC